MTQFKVLGPKDKQKIQNNNRRMLESIGCKGKAKNYKGTNKEQIVLEESSGTKMQKGKKKKKPTSIVGTCSTSKISKLEAELCLWRVCATDTHACAWLVLTNESPIFFFYFKSFGIYIGRDFHLIFGTINTKCGIHIGVSPSLLIHTLILKFI